MKPSTNQLAIEFADWLNEFYQPCNGVWYDKQSSYTHDTEYLWPIFLKQRSKPTKCKLVELYNNINNENS